MTSHPEVPNRAAVLAAVDGVDSLPTFPEVVAEVREELARPDPEPARVAAFIEEDAVLAARFIAVASAPRYSPTAPPRTVRQAVVRVGLAETARVILAVAVYERFRDLGPPDARTFWSHGMAVGLLGSTLARVAGASQEVAELAYTAGLLHDLGVIALYHLFPEVSAAIAARSRKTGRPNHEVERAALGIEHGEVGGRLAARWGLPADLVAVVAHHHHPWTAPAEHRRSVQLVHIADFIAKHAGYVRAEDVPAEDFDAGAWAAWGFSLDDVEAILEKARESGEQAATFFT